MICDISTVFTYFLSTELLVFLVLVFISIYTVKRTNTIIIYIMDRLLESLDPLRVNSNWVQVKSFLQSKENHYFDPIPNNVTGPKTSLLDDQQMASKTLTRLAASLLKESEIVIHLENDLEVMFTSSEITGINNHIPQKIEDLPLEYQFFERYLELFTLVLNSEYNKALLVPIEFPKDYRLKYTKVIMIKVFFLRAIACEAVSKVNEALETYHCASEIVAEMILHSKETAIWAEFFYHQFCLLATDTVGSAFYRLDIDLAIMNSAFTSYKMITKYFSQYKLSQKRTNIPILELLYYWNQAKRYQNTPSISDKIDQLNKTIEAELAASPDDLFLEQYISMQYHVNKLSSEVLLSKIIDASKKTFQSTVIAWCLTLKLLDLGKQEEALQSYTLYWKYNLKKPDRPKNIVLIHKRLSEIDSLIGRDLETKMKFNLRSYTTHDKANAYAVIAQAYENVNNQKASEFYSQSILAYSPNIIPDLSLRYGILQAKDHYSDISNSLNTVKCALQKWENDARLWHLLALILSSLDEDEKAMIAIDKALQILEDSFHDMIMGTKLKINGPTNPSKTTDKNWRERYIEIKWTKLALIEKQDLDQALFYVSSVFNLYYRLYGEEFKDQNTANDLSNLKKKRQSILSRTLSKTFSRTVEVSRSISGIKKHKQLENKYSSPVKNNTEELRILNMLWLKAASLYRRAELYIEAEKAIIQAEKLAGPTNQSHVELGYLILRSRPRLAMNEFEKVLEVDRTNIGAIIGFATLAYGTTEEAITTNSSAGNSKLFVNEVDKQGLLQRSLALLQTTLTKEKSSEAWLLLGQLREVVGDINGAVKAYENCKSIETKRSVRDYAVASI